MFIEDLNKLAHAGKDAAHERVAAGTTGQDKTELVTSIRSAYQDLMHLIARHAMACSSTAALAACGVLHTGNDHRGEPLLRLTAPGIDLPITSLDQIRQQALVLGAALARFDAFLEESGHGDI